MTVHFPYSVADESLLEPIPSRYCRDQKVHRLLPSALQAFETMAKAAEQEGVFLIVYSAFRNFEFQRLLFEDAEQRHGKGMGSVWVAPPGHSEHHTGEVVDIGDGDFPDCDDESTFETTPACAWLFANAQRFGFKLSFPPNNPQGIGYEPWHWRFIA